MGSAGRFQAPFGASRRVLGYSRAVSQAQFTGALRQRGRVRLTSGEVHRYTSAARPGALGRAAGRTWQGGAAHGYSSAARPGT